ncbi:DUF917 domain-containing protein, partial [Burkholderia thailandensis]|nr:DUF917 domain-containing protein [Burkholderia thailandensis]
TLDSDGRPLSAGQLKEGMEIHVLRVTKTHSPLSSSVFDPAIYPSAETALGISIADYAPAR